MPWSRGAASEREREDALLRIRQEREEWGRREVLERLARAVNPQWMDDPAYLEWFVWHHRLTSSPAAWADFRRMQIELDVTDVLPAIRVPTLVITKERSHADAEEVASAIPNAELVLIPGRGGAFSENEFGVEAVEAFLAGSSQPQIPDTVRATVLFTDLVDSTARAAELGDHRWRELLEHHNRVVRRELERFRGRELIRPATASSPASTGRRGQSAAHGRSPSVFPSSGWWCAPASTPGSASAWGRNPPGSPSTSVPASRPQPVLARCSSRGP